jgi:hypothetical protein
MRKHPGKHRDITVKTLMRKIPMKKTFALFLTCLVVTSLAIAQKKSDQPSDYQSKSFAVQKGGTLRVDVDPGAVRIEPWSKDEVLVEAEGIDERHPERLIMEKSGNTVTVKYRDSRHHVDHLQFIINVPSQFNTDIQTTGGSVTQKDVLTGKFSAETKGGSIKIEHIIGSVDVETGGGSIRAEKIEGDATMETGGGSIVTGTVTGILSAETGGGSIRFRNVGGKTNASTGGGSIVVEDAAAPIDLSTGGGSVNVHGGNNGVKVRTGGGSIQMDNITGYVIAATGGGSVNVELMPKGNDNSTITTGGGRITLSVPENAKATIDATIDDRDEWRGRHERSRIISDFKADTYEGDDESEEVHAVYRLNGGGSTITLKTSNSDIRIEKMSAR